MTDTQTSKKKNNSWSLLGVTCLFLAIVFIVSAFLTRDWPFFIIAAFFIIIGLISPSITKSKN